MKQDLEQARRLLKESGYNGEKIVLLHPTDIPALHSASVITASSLREIGVNVEGIIPSLIAFFWNFQLN